MNDDSRLDCSDEAEVQDSYCREIARLNQRVKELKEQRAFLLGTVYACSGHARHHIFAEGCRLVLEQTKVAIEAIAKEK